MTARPNVTAIELPILLALAELGDGGDEGWHWPFKAIANIAGVRPVGVRAPIRRLARKGLAHFASGLWTDDGTPAGSGYMITPMGKAVASAIEARSGETGTGSIGVADESAGPKGDAPEQPA